MASPPTDQPTTSGPLVEQTTLSILLAISFAHLLNDTIQALIPSIYPLLKAEYNLTYTQLGLITLTFQCTASLLQPVIGHLSDKKPRPYSLSAGMGITLLGLLLLSVSHRFELIILSASLVGLGSAIFHPEASRVANLASGGRKGFAQSLFQVGGNAGSALGPLLAMAIIVPRGQGYLAWFSVLAGVGAWVLWHVGRWMNARLQEYGRRPRGVVDSIHHLSRRSVIRALLVLVALVFSKYVYLASMTSYYTFYLIERFGLSIPQSQFYLFLFLFAVALGTIAGGPLGDRIGRKTVIWFSILGVAPFALALPHVGLTATAILTFIIGLVLASAFSAILVYAQDLVPGKVGLIAGLFFGLAFGIAGVGSAVLGKMADLYGIEAVYRLCAYLPLIGLITALLPNLRQPRVP